MGKEQERVIDSMRSSLIMIREKKLGIPHDVAPLDPYRSFFTISPVVNGLLKLDKEGAHLIRFIQGKGCVYLYEFHVDAQKRFSILAGSKKSLDDQETSLFTVYEDDGTPNSMFNDLMGEAVLHFIEAHQKLVEGGEIENGIEKPVSEEDRPIVTEAQLPEEKEAVFSEQVIHWKILLRSIYRIYRENNLLPKGDGKVIYTKILENGKAIRSIIMQNGIRILHENPVEAPSLSNHLSMEYSAFPSDNFVIQEKTYREDEIWKSRTLYSDKPTTMGPAIDISPDLVGRIQSTLFSTASEAIHHLFDEVDITSLHAVVSELAKEWNEMEVEGKKPRTAVEENESFRRSIPRWKKILRIFHKRLQFLGLFEREDEQYNMKIGNLTVTCGGNNEIMVFQNQERASGNASAQSYIMLDTVNEEDIIIFEYVGEKTTLLFNEKLYGTDTQKMLDVSDIRAIRHRILRPLLHSLLGALDLFSENRTIQPEEICVFEQDPIEEAHEDIKKEEMRHVSHDAKAIDFYVHMFLVRDIMCELYECYVTEHLDPEGNIDSTDEYSESFEDTSLGNEGILSVDVSDGHITIGMNTRMANGYWLRRMITHNYDANLVAFHAFVSENLTEAWVFSSETVYATDGSEDLRMRPMDELIDRIMEEYMKPLLGIILPRLGKIPHRVLEEWKRHAGLAFAEKFERQLFAGVKKDFYFKIRGLEKDIEEPIVEEKEIEEPENPIRKRAYARPRREK